MALRNCEASRRTLTMPRHLGRRIEPVTDMIRQLLQPTSLFARMRAPASTVRLFYYNPISRKNVGDQLNVRLMQALTGRAVVWAPAATADLVAIGSLLDLLLGSPSDRDRTRPSLAVWGSGFLAPSGEHPHVHAERTDVFRRSVVLHAVRGRQTRDRLAAMGFDVERVALGDPGLLAARLLTGGVLPPRRFALGLVPHYVDANAPVWEQTRRRLRDVRILRVSDPPDRFLAEMRTCDVIISSAMHGLILADAFGIPNIRVRVSDRLIGGDYKFADYYSVFGISPAPLSIEDLRTLTQADIAMIRSRYAVSTAMVTNVVNSLLAHCPLPIVTVNGRAEST